MKGAVLGKSWECHVYVDALSPGPILRTASVASDVRSGEFGSPIPRDRSSRILKVNEVQPLDVGPDNGVSH